MIAAVLAYFGKMTGDIGIVFAAAIGSYNWANARGKEHGQD